MSLWAFVCSVLLCSLWEKICHSSFVIMSFCLKKHTCLSLSLCHSVLKTTPSVTPVLLLLCLQNYPVSLCHYVILSKKVHLSSSVPLLFCLQDHPFCYSCPPVTLSSKLPRLLCPHVTLSSKTTLSGYLYYYIYPACDRLFCVVPLHRHQEWKRWQAGHSTTGGAEEDEAVGRRWTRQWEIKQSIIYKVYDER